MNVLSSTSTFPVLISALILGSALTGRAGMLPSPTVHELCREADLIIDAEQVEGDRVKVTKILKAPAGLDRDALTTLDVQDLGRLDRRLTRGWQPGERAITTRTAVLFLKRRTEGEKTWWTACDTSNQERAWGSPGVYWYDAAGCYGYDQVMNPGPYRLVAGKADARYFQVPAEIATLRDRIDKGLALNTQWEEVLALPDPAAKAAALARYLLPRTAPEHYTDSYTRELRQRMRELGAPAVPALIKVLESSQPDDNLNTALLVLCDIGGMAQFRKEPSPTAAALPVLRKVLASPGKSAKYYVVCAMRKTLDPSAIADLRPLLNDADRQVEKEAAEAVAELEKIGAQS